jgi:hypothetical protein
VSGWPAGARAARISQGHRPAETTARYPVVLTPTRFTGTPAQISFSPVERVSTALATKGQGQMILADGP